MIVSKIAFSIRLLECVIHLDAVLLSAVLTAFTLSVMQVRDKRKWLCSNSEVDRHRAGVVVPSMFPSGKGWDLSADLDATVLTTDSVPEKKPDANVQEEPVLDENVQQEGVQEETVREENDDEVVVGEVEVSSLPLERCMRILPQDQDTGGFFIAVFRKNSPFKGIYSKLCTFLSSSRIPWTPSSTRTGDESLLDDGMRQH